MFIAKRKKEPVPRFYSVEWTRVDASIRTGRLKSPNGNTTLATVSVSSTLDRAAIDATLREQYRLADGLQILHMGAVNAIPD